METEIPTHCRKDQTPVNKETTPITPEVGMGGYLAVGSDRYAVTIQTVVSNKEIGVTHDTATRTDKNGLSESQSYHFKSNPNAHIEYYTLRKNGRWVRKGESIKGSKLYIGERSHYQDPSY